MFEPDPDVRSRRGHLELGEHRSVGLDRDRDRASATIDDGVLPALALEGHPLVDDESAGVRACFDVDGPACPDHGQGSGDGRGVVGHDDVRRQPRADLDECPRRAVVRNVVPAGDATLPLDLGDVLATEFDGAGIVRFARTPVRVCRRLAARPDESALDGLVVEPDAEARLREGGRQPVLLGLIVDGDEVATDRNGVGLGTGIVV